MFCVWEDVGEIVEVSGIVLVVGIVKFEIFCVVLEDCCIVVCVVGEDCCYVFCIELDGWKICGVVVLFKKNIVIMFNIFVFIFILKVYNLWNENFFYNISNNVIVF